MSNQATFWDLDRALFLEKQVKELFRRARDMEQEIRDIYWKATLYCGTHPDVRLTYTGMASHELGFFCSSCKPNYYEGL